MSNIMKKSIKQRLKELWILPDVYPSELCGE